MTNPTEDRNPPENEQAAPENEATSPGPTPAPPAPTPPTPPTPPAPSAPPAPTPPADSMLPKPQALSEPDQTNQSPTPESTAGQHAAPRVAPPAVTRVPTAETLAKTAPSTPPATAGSAAARAQQIPPAVDPTAGADASGQAAPAHPFTPVGAAATGSAAGTETDPDTTTSPTAPATGDEPPAPTRRARRERTDLPEPPPRPGVARHVLGVLVGGFLTPIGLVLSTVAMARLAAVSMPTELVTADLTGLSMLVVGAVVLFLVVALGLWTPSVPLTGGVVWGLGFGLLYLIAPVIVEDWVDSAYSSRPGSLVQLLDRLADGTWVTLGLVLVAAGLVAGLARRRGRVFGEQTALATQARIEAARADESRQQIADAEEALLADRARSID